MANINQVSAGVAAFYDREIRQTLPDVKGKLYGVAVGVAMAKPEKTFEKVIPAARMMGIIDDSGDVDVDLLAKEVRRNMFTDGAFKIELALNPFKPTDIDVFKFTDKDVDRLVEYIKNA